MPVLADFDFTLDPSRIAQRPVEPRDASKLLVFHRQIAKVDHVRRKSVTGAGSAAGTAGTTGAAGDCNAAPAEKMAAPPPCLEHRRFADIVDYLQPNDTLVLNRSRVIPARLFGERVPTRGKVEVLLIRPVAAAGQRARWNCLTQAKASMKPGDRIFLPNVPLTGITGQGGSGVGGTGSASDASGGVTATLIERLGLDGDILEFDRSPTEFEAWFPTVGHMPLPPYIRRKAAEDLPAAELARLEEIDHDRYQTVYAREDGSVAAPTAGLHFTPELLDRLRRKGVRVTELILHVGPGTFRPVKTERLSEHIMHEEPFEIPAACAEAIAAARNERGRVVAVGTTALRALESATPIGADRPTAGAGSTRLFLYPPAEFRCVNGLITNFHLPKSTLLMLVAAFAAPGSTAGIAAMQAAYREAIAKEYRFFSYGDAMLIC